MSGPSLAGARSLVDRALLLLNGHGIFTKCQGSPVPFVDLRNVTDEDAERNCSGCPLLKWQTDDGSVRNICLQLGRAEGASAIGYVYGGKVMRRNTNRKKKAQ